MKSILVTAIFWQQTGESVQALENPSSLLTSYAQCLLTPDTPCPTMTHDDVYTVRSSPNHPHPHLTPLSSFTPSL